jgi:stage III sporulation protein AH
MKKGKIIGKKQIVLAALVLCLAAAVFLNMRYASFENPSTVNPESDLGDNQYLSSGGNLGEAVQTGTGVDYIATARAERNNTRQSALDKFNETINNSSLSSEEKMAAIGLAAEEAKRMEKESSAETVIKAKGFKDALVMISDTGVTVIVPAETLLQSETLQIQDAVTSQIEIELEKIKIITVK